MGKRTKGWAPEHPYKKLGFDKKNYVVNELIRFKLTNATCNFGGESRLPNTHMGETFFLRKTFGILCNSIAICTTSEDEDSKKSRGIFYFRLLSI